MKLAVISADSPIALTIGLDTRRSLSWFSSCASSWMVGTWHSHISARPGMGWKGVRRDEVREDGMHWL